MDDLDAFIEQAKALASEAQEGQRIKEAAMKGLVPTLYYHHDSAPGEDGRLREMARDAIGEVWAYFKRPATHDEIYEKVLQMIALDIELGHWPAIWRSHPKQRTVERRTNEIAGDRPQFWLGLEVSPVIMVKPGFYQPNPYLFDDSVRDDIAKEEIKLVGDSPSGPKGSLNRQSGRPPLHSKEAD